jgi:hypothetical protein
MDHSTQNFAYESEDCWLYSKDNRKKKEITDEILFAF